MARVTSGLSAGQSFCQKSCGIPPSTGNACRQFSQVTWSEGVASFPPQIGQAREISSAVLVFAFIFHESYHSEWARQSFKAYTYDAYCAARDGMLA
jgi:hypothetical protein